MSNRSDRIVGVDIAKIIAMLLVVALHVDGCGLPYVGDSPPRFGYLLLRSFLGAIFMSCINIFAIASGYVGISSSFKLSRIIRLWIQVVFTGLVILTCLDLFTSINVQLEDYMRACVPIAKRQYWYMTAYFMLCFVTPLLNAGIKRLASQDLRYLIILLVCVICGESFVCSAGALGVEGGYSFEWLLVLYMVGAYIRLYNPLCKSKWALFGAVCLCALIVGWAPLLLQSAALSNIIHIPNPLKFGGYTSPFIIIMSVCIFALCVKVRITSEKARKVIVFLSQTTLGVYLIHVQPVFFGGIFGCFVRKLTVSDGCGYFCSIVIATTAIYVICSMLDFLRILFFSYVERMAHGRNWVHQLPFRLYSVVLGAYSMDHLAKT